MDSAIAAPVICSRQTCIRKSFRRGLVIPASLIRWDICSHLMPNMQTDAVARVDEAFQAALKEAHQGCWVAKGHFNL
jgi:hypothetical protein